MVQKGPKIDFFEVHESNTSGLQGPPRGSILRVLTFLCKNIDSDEFGDTACSKIASSKAILGPKWSKKSQKSIFRSP